MSSNPIVSGVDNQVTIYKNGQVQTAQEGVRKNDPNGVSELNRKLADGWSTTPPATTSAPSAPTRSADEGYEIGKALYSFLPENVLREFSRQWVKSGDPAIAIGATRNSKSWQDKFGYLKREDGSLIMDELSALSTIATYKQTLGEVGILDYTEFEDDFETMIAGEVSGAEFQQRIDTVYAGVVNQIPEVERLFRERYNVNLNQPTIFAALINPKIQDKVLAGEIETIQLQAEATSRGFSTSFARFQKLKNLGLTKKQARDLYESAGSIMRQADTIGRDLQLETLEQAAIGDIAAQRRLQRVQAELESQQGLTLGAAKKGDEFTGLIAD